MRDLNAQVSGVAGAPIERAFACLRDIERYPQWCPAFVSGVTALERDENEAARRVEFALQVNIGPIHHALRMEMGVEAHKPTLVVLRRIARDDQDRETFVISWYLAPNDREHTDLQLEISAHRNVPPMMPAERVFRQVAAGFLSAAIEHIA